MTTLPALCNESVINEKAKTISNFNKASGIFFENKKQRRWPIRPDRVLNKWEENFAMHKY